MGKSNLKTIYKITVKNWEKYNSSKKKGHNCILLSTGFLQDAKIAMLPPSGKIVFLGLLLRCGEVCANSIECSHEQLVMLAGGQGNDVSRLLSLFEELQLVTIAKNAPLLDRIEKKSKEKKSKVATRISKKENANSTTASPVVQVGRDLVAVYCDAWTARYRGRPPLRPQDTRQLKSIGEQNGFERTKELLIAYLNMPESWFLQKRHDLATFFSNLTGVAQFIETGAVVTKAKLRAVEGAQNLESTIRSIREEGI